jgi:hypothetical protein
MKQEGGLDTAGVWSHQTSVQPVSDTSPDSCGNARDIPERFAAKPVSDFRKRDSFRVGKTQPRRQLGPQDPILGGEVFVPQQKFLVDGAGHVSEKSHPSTVPHAAVYLPVLPMV